MKRLPYIFTTVVSFIFFIANSYPQPEIEPASHQENYASIDIIEPSGNIFESFTIPKSLTICDAGSITWTEDITYVDEIRVCAGSTLTIQSEVRFVEGGKLVVERGGKLVIDGGTLTSVSDAMWRGIELWGTASASQNAIDQGWVQMINEGMIENASVGIRTCKIDNDITDGEEIDFNYTGGIIQASNATFRNNRLAVIFYDYGFTSFSNFSDCDFILNDSYFGVNEPGYFVKLNSMKDVDFAYCRFKNESSNDCFGKGIFSFDSKFNVKGKCLSGDDPCTELAKSEFHNLKYGIYATSGGSLDFPVISQADFTGNYRGVYFSGMQNGIVKNCTITTGPACAGASYGIYLDRSTGYAIEENKFFQGLSPGIGMVINNSGDENNLVYNNRFEAMYYAIIAQNENRAPDGTGLVLKCNEYIGNTFDQVVTWKEPFLTGYAGIAAAQGANLAAPDAPAGNQFSQTGTTAFSDFYNEANDVEYYYHFTEFDPYRHFPKYRSAEKVFPHEVLNAQWIPEESCPPSDQGGGGGSGDTEEMKSLITLSGQKADSVNAIIAVLKDGGNTEALKWEVDMSTPPETYTVYNELMNNSPYISDTVMESAIEKEEVLPNVMIRDVMVANPHNAKDESLLEKIGDRSDPMPEYMIAQILQGQSLVSAFENLQSQKAFYKQQRSLATNALIKMYLSDTLDPATSKDSLKVLLENENSKGAKYRLAFLSMEQGAWSEGLQVLNEIPQQFDLTEDELATHQQYAAFYNLLAGLVQQGKTVSEVDSAQIELLLNIEAMQAGKPSVYALNVLLALEQIEYEEPILLPDLFKSTAVQEERQRIMQSLQEHHYMSLFPNPAGDYLIIEHNLEMEHQKVLVNINNIKGECIKRVELTGRQNQQTVDIQSLKAGIYTATIYADQKELETVKFTKK